MSPQLTTQQLKRALAIREQIDSLEIELSALLGGSATTTTGRRGPRTMSAAARERIAEAQRKRWAKQRGGPAPVKTRKRRKMSPAARAKISAVAKARWAKAKASNRNRL